MTALADDHLYMARALRLAERGLCTTDPNPRVGCVIVADGEIVGEGWHERAGGPHAEVNALQMAGGRAAGARAYVTLEPCCHHGRTPPCTAALIEAGIARVIVATSDTNAKVAGKGLAQLEAAGIEAVAGPLGAQSRALNCGYFKRHESARPYVRAKLAMSLDGRTALADGTSQWISGAASRADVQAWRAGSSAVLTGVGTVLADDPSLNVRAAELSHALAPARVIVDSRLRTPPAAKTLNLPGDVYIFHGDNAGVAAELSAAGAIVERLPEIDGRVSLPAVMERLAELEMNEILVEAGSTLNGALLQHGLVDEIIAYVAPHLLGDTAQGMFALPPLSSMAERVKLELQELRRFDADIRLRYRPA